MSQLTVIEVHEGKPLGDPLSHRFLWHNHDRNHFLTINIRAAVALIPESSYILNFAPAKLSNERCSLWTDDG